MLKAFSFGVALVAILIGYISVMNRELLLRIPKVGFIFYAVTGNVPTIPRYMPSRIFTLNVLSTPDPNKLLFVTSPTLY